MLEAASCWDPRQADGCTSVTDGLMRLRDELCTINVRVLQHTLSCLLRFCVVACPAQRHRSGVPHAYAPPVLSVASLGIWQVADGESDRLSVFRPPRSVIVGGSAQPSIPSIVSKKVKCGQFLEAATAHCE